MTEPMTTYTDATDLSTAIENFRKFAQDTFNEAVRQAQIPIPPNLTGQPLTDANTALGKAKSSMASALQQLISAASMISDQNGRDGYAALVTLMGNTSTMAEDVNVKIRAVMNDTSGGIPEQQARNQQLDSLAGVIQALAQIAPIQAWQKTPASGS